MGKNTGTVAVKLIAIGNSKGIVIPDVLREKYGWGDEVLLEEVDDGVLLRRGRREHMTWKETYRAMAAEAASGGLD